MAWRCGGSISRSLLSSRTSAFASLRLRPSPPSPLPRLRSSPLPSSAPPRLRSRPLSSPSRSLGALACAQSLLPLHSLTSHLSVEARACCELSQGRNGKDG
ncbi:hypothetical protein QJS04_geneDACA006326 [Acorus gramineus]|uniref:Uncharacterized protein n=1 Tax=Acorus gramineus TaxID=55184 RepID=A0AAV9AZM2_ACOGR|nr:hypothetical protein QJS04_geneDACA006326 [Acorus gramineus]